MIDVFYFFFFNRTVIFLDPHFKKVISFHQKLCWHLNCTATSEQHCFSHNFYQHQMSYCPNNYLWQSLSENLKSTKGTSIKLPLVNFWTYSLRNSHILNSLSKTFLKTLHDFKGPTFNLCKAQLDIYNQIFAGWLSC